MKKIILACCCGSFLILACKKNGGTVAAEGYMNMTAGNTWNYDLVNNNPPGTTPYTLTSTNRDTTINGKSYHIFTNSNGNISEYYNITGNDYYSWISLPAPLSTSVENL